MKKYAKIILKLSLVTVLIAVTALSLFSCTSGEKDTDTGEKTITIVVTHKSGDKTEHILTTTASNLGAALEESGFVDGENGQYGFYVNAVDGEIADYNVDGSFWSISQDGEELFTGASDTVIHDGEHYELTYTVIN